MTRRIVGGSKDANGIFIKEPDAPTPAPEPSDISIDDLMKAGLQAIRGSMKAVMSDVNTGMPSRETIQNLKDLMSMLRDLKKEEKELLDNLSEEEIEKLIRK